MAQPAFSRHLFSFLHPCPLIKYYWLAIALLTVRQRFPSTWRRQLFGATRSRQRFPARFWQRLLASLWSFRRRHAEVFSSQFYFLFNILFKKYSLIYLFILSPTCCHACRAQTWAQKRLTCSLHGILWISLFFFTRSITLHRQTHNPPASAQVAVFIRSSNKNSF